MKERIRDPIPVWRSTVDEVNLDLGIEMGVEPKSGIRRVETGKTSVTENGLRPRHRRTRCLESAVVLRSALHVLRVRWVHRQALELQGLEAVVQARICSGSAGQQLLASAKRRLC